MTSVFSPINGVGRERFAPVKIALSSQEWCGQVHQLAKPTADRLYSQIRSYFSRDGEQNRMVRTPDFTLYEDALLIQLRELDGPFAGGRSWSGFIVPTLWSLRKEHRKASAVPATITRSEAVRKGRSVTRFVLRYGSYERTYEVEKALPRRILRWETNRGHRARLLGTERLAYWKLNHQGGKRWREALGLPREVVGGARAEDPAPRDSPTLPR
jgi:hypothetical protein